VTLSRIKDVNDNVRLFQLKPVEEEGRENIKVRYFFHSSLARDACLIAVDGHGVFNHVIRE